MIQNRHQGRWLFVAVVAIAIALVLMLMPHAHSGNSAIWVVILPVLFIGVAAPPCLLRSPDCFDLIHTTGAPALQPSFQRPPPSQFA